MASPTRNRIWDRGLGVLNTDRDEKTNTITASLGDEVQGADISDNAEWWQHIGFASRPSKPEQGVAGPQVVALCASDGDVCIASRDVRCHGIYGALDYGETCLFAGGEDGTGQARVLLKKDGGIHLYTRRGNTPSGAGMVVQLDAQNNAIRLLNGSGFGLIIDADGVRVTAGANGGGLTVGADGGVKLIAKQQVQVDGATVLLGSVAVPVVNAALKGPTGITAVPSVKVLIE